MRKQSNQRGFAADGTLECSACHQFKSPDQFRADKRLEYRGGRDYRCRECRCRITNEWRGKNKDQAIAATKLWKENIRQKCFDHYGAECAWCGEKDQGTLTLDHINNDGHIERKKLGMSWLWHHAVKSKFPDTYRILCMGCNTYRAWHKKLPESKKRLDIRMFALSDYAKTVGEGVQP